MSTKDRNRIFANARRGLAIFVVVWLAFASPVVTFAQSVDATGQPTGAPADTGAPACTGSGCGQGADQGTNQGTDQGGQSAEELGADENGDLPAGTNDTRQGANQGSAAGSGNGTEASNTNTGADSTNQTGVNTANNSTTTVNNTATDNTTGAATGSTGGNTSSSNTGSAGITTGNAGIGVTQVKNDNTTTIGGTAGLNVTGHNGTYNGDLNLGFGAGTANLGSGTGSVQAVNNTTGSGSTNGVDINTTTTELTEVQNDGQIENLLDLAAITGQNVADKNTGDASITTGDANVAATLVNLLNTTVINGNLWVTVADIFGDLNGNINLPDFAAFLSSMQNSGLSVDASNGSTGADSTNTIDVTATDTETTNVTNDADITTTVNANAITGQNQTQANTGGANVTTGNGQVSASNISLANTTIEGGNWGLVIVNALNGWLGFLVGDGGQVQALSQEETLRHIEANNSNTGENSDNTIAVNDEHTEETNVTNDAEITNTITASAITGQNEADKNTGGAEISTGDANIAATTVNIANTTVKNGSLFIAVVNIFGDWFGDLMYGGRSLAAAAGSGGSTVAIDATNHDTGADSTNTIDVEYNRNQETNIDNEADLSTTLNANIDTGNNRANRNTGGATIDTGDGLLALHSRAAANLTAIAGDAGLSVTVEGLNDTTGFDSTNRINARINDNRLIDVDNEANVSTVFAGVANTGNNEANQNTLGADIVTGNIDATVAIQNMVNQVLIALAGHGITVDAEFANHLTGAFSNNSNDVAVVRNFLVAVDNVGLIDNLINLLLNTGGNRANENTGGGNISTGSICVDGKLVNDVNRVSGITAGVSLELTQDADVNNEASVAGTTGNNEANRNTGDPQGPVSEECPKLAQAPSPTPSVQPSPTPGGQGGGPGPEGKGGGDVGPDAQGGGEEQPRVAAAVSKPAPRVTPTQILKRFPVAGAEQAAAILQGKKRLLWQLFLAASVGLLATAWAFDQRSRARHLNQLA